MKITVVRGSIKHNDRIYKLGESLELDEKGALAIIHSGIAEEFVQPVAQKNVKVEKVEKDKEVEVEAVEFEPSLDWTRPELNDYAKEQGIEEPETLANKTEVLKAINDKIN